MKFKAGKCTKCGQIGEILYTNNPIAIPVCFDCIQKELKYNDKLNILIVVLAFYFSLFPVHFSPLILPFSLGTIQNINQI